MTDHDLVKLASEARGNAYAPYSGFRVGAALLSGNDKIYTGVNIENASYGATNCAERTAIFKAVSEGERSIKTIAIASDAEDFVFPCGICRQVIAEFGDSGTRIICSSGDGKFEAYRLEELLPKAFTKP